MQLQQEGNRRERRGTWSLPAL